MNGFGRTAPHDRPGSRTGSTPGWDEPPGFAPPQPWGDPNGDYAGDRDAPAGAAPAGFRAPAGPAGPRDGRPPAGRAPRGGSGAGTGPGAAGERREPGSPSGWGPPPAGGWDGPQTDNPPGADSVAGGKKRDQKAGKGGKKAAKAAKAPSGRAARRAAQAAAAAPSVAPPGAVPGAGPGSWPADGRPGSADPRGRDAGRSPRPGADGAPPDGGAAGRSPRPGRSGQPELVPSGRTGGSASRSGTAVQDRPGAQPGPGPAAPSRHDGPGRDREPAVTGARAAQATQTAPAGRAGTAVKPATAPRPAPAAKPGGKGKGSKAKTSPAGPAAAPKRRGKLSRPVVWAARVPRARRRGDRIYRAAVVGRAAHAGDPEPDRFVYQAARAGQEDGRRGAAEADSGQERGRGEERGLRGLPGPHRPGRAGQPADHPVHRRQPDRHLGRGLHRQLHQPVRRGAAYRPGFARRQRGLPGPASPAGWRSARGRTTTRLA